MLFSWPSENSQLFVRKASLPPTLFGFILRVSLWHQVGVSLISVVVFLLSAAPIELQRRVIDAAVKGDPAQAILSLIAIQIVVVASFGLIKLLMNVYRSWISESATRALRMIIDLRLSKSPAAVRHHRDNAVGVAIVLAEADEVGAFVGTSMSIPIVEAGFLISVFVYLVGLESRLAIVSLVVLAPQLLFVPLLQRSINQRVSSRTLLLREIGSDLIAKDGKRDSDSEKLDTVFYLNMGIFELKFSLNFLMNLSYSFGTIFVLGVGSLLVVHGEAEIATVVTFLSAMSKVIDPWNDLIDWGRNLAMTSVRYGLITSGFVQLGLEARTESEN